MSLASQTKSKPALVAYLRHELVAPVHAIRDRCQLLLEGAKERGHESSLADVDHESFLADVQKMHESAVQLVNLVTRSLKRRKDKVDEQGVGVKVRHDIRNLIDQVSGYCNLLLLASEELFIDPFIPDLRKICAYCQKCVNLIDRVVEFSRTEPVETDIDPVTAAT